jgi:TonB family protein
MNKKSLFAGILVFLLAASVWAQPMEQAGAAKAGTPAWGMMKLRVFEGQREGVVEPVKVVTTSFLNYTVTASIQSEADTQAQQAKLKQIFNLKGISLLTEADLVWEKGRIEGALHFFRLGDKDYQIAVTPVDIPKLRFRIVVFEQKGGIKTSLLDTEFTMAPKNAAVFGFGAADGKPYFLSMQTIKWPSEMEAKAILGADAVPAEGPVRAVGTIQPPKLLEMIQPVYPKDASAAGVQGTVILEAQTDLTGRIVNAKILRSVPMLDKAAIDAVRQWVYEPLLINGKPRSVIFTVTVRFKLDSKPETKALPKEDLDQLQKMAPVKAEGNVKAPLLKKQVNPVYPEEARAAGVEGIVILEAVIDVNGRIEAARVVKSIPALDKAAIDAVRQWEYEPVIVEGKPRRCTFTVTVRFTLS